MLKFNRTFSLFAKSAGILILVFLFTFNIKITFFNNNDYEGNGVSLLGLELSLFESAVAEEPTHHWTWLVYWGLCYNTELGVVCYMCCENFSPYELCYHGECGEGYIL